MPREWEVVKLTVYIHLTNKSIKLGSSQNQKTSFVNYVFYVHHSEFIC